MVVVRMAGWLVAQGLSLVGLALLWVVEAPFQVVVALLVAQLQVQLDSEDPPSLDLILASHQPQSQ